MHRFLCPFFVALYIFFSLSFLLRLGMVEKGQPTMTTGRYTATEWLHGRVSDGTGNGKVRKKMPLLLRPPWTFGPHVAG